MLTRALTIVAGLSSALMASACPYAATAAGGEIGHHSEMAEKEAARITTRKLNSNATTTTCSVVDESPVHGLIAELRMISRQSRGLITVIDNCRFEVNRLELALAGSEESIDLDWYWTIGLEDDDVADRSLLAEGGTFSQDDLTGNSNLSWDAEVSMEQVGAILLYERDTDNQLARVLIQKLKPGPAKDLLEAQPTYFDNCLGVSKTMRLRWSIVDTEFLEMGLEYIAPFSDATNTWAAFGPGSPGVQDRLMGGSDVVIAGFRQLGEDEDSVEEPFADDYYIGGYEVCTDVTDTADNFTYDGVCRDSVWISGMDDMEDMDVNNVELLHSQVLEGVALLRYRRPLSGTTPTFDHDILPGTEQHFVWARGPLDPTQGIAEVQFHGYQFGQLKYLDLQKPTWTCPPLEGVELGGTQSLIDTDEDDAFSQQFDHQAVLQGDLVEVYWTLMPESSQIRLGARAVKGSSKWMSVAIGSSMTDAWAWVATVDGDEPQLLTYRMSGLDATTVQMLEEEQGMIAETPIVTDAGGLLSFQVVAKWPLPGMEEGETSAPLIWAVGPSWRSSESSPERKDEHSVRSKAPTSIDFATGGAEVGEQPSNNMLLAHAAFMWIAWLVAAPFVGIASRYVRDDPCMLNTTGVPSWIELHKKGALTVLLLSLLGLILAVAAVADAGLKHILSSHAKIGVSLLAIVTVQNSFGMVRPSPGDGMKRRIWEVSHRVFAVTMLSLAVAAVITGSTRLEDFDSQTRFGVELSVAWILVVVFVFCVYEFRKRMLAREAVAATEPDNQEKEEEAAAAAEENPVPKSTWTKTFMVVYTIPCILGLYSLIIIAAVTFSGYKSIEMAASSPSTATIETQSTATDEMTVPPMIVPPVSDEVTDITVTIDLNPSKPGTVPTVVVSQQDCNAYPFAHVGDGWCDDHTPFNTAECGWDGGDCCNTNAGLYNCKDPSSPNFGKSSPKGWESPLVIPRNPRYSVSRAETTEAWVISYNNYYEFGFSKDVVEEANEHADFLAPETWYIDISGLVENPMTIDVPALINDLNLEERMYRHRCVEAWSITVPWIGFPLSKLLDMVKPKPEAAIVQFVSWKDFSISMTQATSIYPWPYTEALTIDEAKNELAMLTVGAFGKLLTPQQGAPIRLNVPWKYGFKSIKSIQQINFLEDERESRQTFWSVANGREYGFYANVNPEVPHPRWSQATERHYITGFPGVRMDTTRMNGYQAEVDYMYADDIDNREIYF